MARVKHTKYPEVQCQRCGTTYGGHPGSKKPPKTCVVHPYSEGKCGGRLNLTERGKRQWYAVLGRRIATFNANLTPAPSGALEK